MLDPTDDPDDPALARDDAPNPAADNHSDSDLGLAALQQMLLATETVQEFLDQLVQRAAAETGHHCGITIGPSDARHDAYTVASSDELSLQLDELQYADGDGPCLEALRSAVPVIVTDMTTETRWPAYLEHARATGARSSLSYPLLNGGRAIGAINLYASEALTPRADLQARAGRLADLAAGAVALALRLAQRQDMIAHLNTALTSRSTIDKAIGILMVQQRCKEDAASTYCAGHLRDATSNCATSPPASSPPSNATHPETHAAGSNRALPAALSAIGVAVDRGVEAAPPDLAREALRLAQHLGRMRGRANDLAQSAASPQNIQNRPARPNATQRI